MYFDKKTITREMYLQFPREGDSIVIAGLKIIGMGISALIMVVFCWKKGR